MDKENGSPKASRWFGEKIMVLDAIEIGIAVFDSGVVRRVDAIQSHCSVYEKRG